MCNEVVDPEALFKEFEQVTNQLKELLDDLEWRKPDVESEEAKLKELQKAAKEDPSVDFASQAIVVRVLRSVLDDKIVEAKRLEKRMLELKTQIEALSREETEAGEEEEGGETVR